MSTPGGKHTNKVSADARIDPRIRKAFAGFPGALGGAVARGTYATRDDYIQAVYSASSPPIPAAQDIPKEVRALWSKKGLRISEHAIISSPDGNEIKFIMYRPAESDGKPLPCVVYLHGGGMAFNSAFDPTYKVWNRVIAKQGVAVCAVDFRNCVVPAGFFAPGKGNMEVAPFPAGLNDCYSAIKHIHAHAKELQVQPSLTIAGESGGGNLSLACALKAKQMGELAMLRGVYAMCPYIAGAWPQDVTNAQRLGTSHLDSENNDIFLGLGGNAGAIGYGIEAFKAGNPLAWPGFATVDDLKGLPPVVISLNECDPLRDEGLVFYRKLLRAGVSARCREVLGTPHGGELMVSVTPDISLETARSIKDFATGATHTPLSRL